MRRKLLWHCKSRPNFSFGIGAETGRKLSFGVGSVSLGSSAVSFSFGRISGVFSALTDRKFSRAGCIICIPSTASEVTTLRRYTNLFIIIIIVLDKKPESPVRPAVTIKSLTPALMANEVHNRLPLFSSNGVHIVNSF